MENNLSLFAFLGGVIALLLADIHGRTHVLEKILTSAGAFDLIIVAGDLTDFGNEEKANEVLAALKKAGKPVFAVPGNCDPPEVLRALENGGTSIHGKSKRVGGFVFAGFGGSNPTPFDTPFEMPDDGLGEGIASACAGVGNKKLVLITHAPPKNTRLDKLPNGTHAGSGAVLKAIETHKPTFLFCGHIHEGIGNECVGGALVVNPGPASAGHCGLVDLDNKKVFLKGLGVER